MDKDIHLLSRQSPPNQYDTFPFGTECYVKEEDRTYIQNSKDESKPNWIIKE